MSIWRYDDQSASPPEGVRPSHCPFCKTAVHFFSEDSVVGTLDTDPWTKARQRRHDNMPDWAWQAAPAKWLDTCPTCGWWSVSYHSRQDLGLDVLAHIHRASGALCQLDPSDISLPTDELCRYLTAKYDERFNIHPRSYENIVGAVFKEAGYRVRVSSYSNDDGIDVFVFDGDGNDVVGIQVKRYRDKIQADQIREFAGALVLHSMTDGIYVTTSTFTRGANSTASQFANQGIRIRLLDAAAFYDHLRLATRTEYRDPNDVDAPFAKVWRDSNGLSEVAGFSCGRG